MNFSSPASTAAMPTPFSRDLFTYGSLMCEEIMAEVAGSRLPSTPATLAGYRRFLVQDEQYPGVVVDPAGVVAGMVYHTISPDNWKRLDRFEGEMYDRRPVTVRYADGCEAVVDCYLFRPEFAHRLTATEWDFAAFLHDGKQQFHQQYRGFKAID
ncbi:AIG2 family protein [Desulfobulbus propionicus DSM 2032]|jgi:AIG2-like family.|uniref:Putative gamma-glutamylcyclotransferase n=1 Tax=Desulfobulbus propionicus (strain ATCC 33891 / DSM 2032 / VKM B-1956 / 1pr3) TaxID=577650 RepID=A0A7U4DPP6_DESPD|nr:gamma-glutamylcyclotransferase family protein [Desulfobulbus propionicus]ADW18277.1 AIG2 family protein [Desulfobulbus propionicus DSM 2032]